MTNQDTLSSGILRQRRNLLIISLILFSKDFADIEIGTSAKISGVHLTIGNPSALNVLLWAIFFYFTYRYFQYYLTIGKSSFNRQLYEYLEKYCGPIIKQLFQQRTNGLTIRSLDIGNMAYHELKRNNWIIRYSTPEDGDFEPPNYPRSMSIDRWDLRNQIMKAWIEVLFFKNGGTDYLLPFIVAGIVLIYCNVNYFLQFLILIKALLFQT